MVEQKTCSGCGLSKDFSEFYERPERPAGHKSRCKECVKSAVKAYRTANPEKARASQKRCEAKKPEQYREMRRRKYLRGRERGYVNYTENDWAKVLKKTYGITAEEYKLIFDEQGGRCAICRNIVSYRLCVDHDHDTGETRGLLCKGCNVGIGHLKDSVELLQSALAYLQFHRKKKPVDQASPSHTIQ